MPGFRLRTTIAVVTVCVACSAPPQQVHKSALRRMLYVVPEALPQQYDWQIRRTHVTDVVWVGARFHRQGSLTGEGRVLAAMEKHGSAQHKHHLLISLGDVAAGVAILTERAVRATSHKALLATLKKNPQVAGVQLDFEYLPASLAASYVSYIRDLKALMPRETTLHIAVFPPVGMPAAWRGFHQHPGLAAASDGIVVMLYDYHRPGTAPGCVSGIAWLNDNVRELAALPREKVWLGAPLYGYQFGRGKTVALGRRRFEKLAGPKTEADGCYRMTSDSDARSFYPAAALYNEFDRLARINAFAGVAYWRAGFER